MPWLSPKIVTFLNRDWNDGYSNQSLIQLQSTATCQLQIYDPNALPDCVIDRALDLVSRLQENCTTLRGGDSDGHSETA